MKITAIEIDNIKGIANLNLNAELVPNKVNIFVAPNGFGKTSFGIGFKSLNSSKIELDEKHLHNGDIRNLPVIKLSVTDTAGSRLLVADHTMNQIRDEFDVFVINSQLKASGTVQRYGGRTISRFSLDIQPTILVEKIPNQANFDYRKTVLNQSFGANSKVLDNVNGIIHNPVLLRRILSQVNINELKLGRTLNPLQIFLNQINGVNGVASNVLQYIDQNVETFLEANVEINKLTRIINQMKFPGQETLAKSFLVAWQLIKLMYPMTKTQVEKVFNYCDFIEYSEYTTRLISDFNTTRFSIAPVVEKKKLVVNWPKAHEISNGQRDILNFVALLLKARIDLNKQNQILVIDEVFDYLDDANLISFQYFLTDLIDRAVHRGINLFSVLLTHLDPNFFNHFCFSDGKLKVFYLKEYNIDQSLNLHKIIYNREEPSIKAELDEYFFHFNPQQIDIQNKFDALGLVKEWGDTNKFHRKIYREVENYLDGKKYDPLAICFALRKVIEMKVYNLIHNAVQKDAFLKVHGTKNKLLYAQSLGIVIPETYFLLGIIYNTSLHLYNGQNITNPLAFKLENLTIKQLIHETCRK
ncbi:hypothetical protein AAEO56_06210 [Flavobacterium sp. DGU11]|uniref:Rad50/SbcC-type AAA domain-containing protein n=1 Tax=Flavobacterium arundinis TaxID=3139143 RepID=A0ABU9HVD5_9FLAO